VGTKYDGSQREVERHREHFRINATVVTSIDSPRTALVRGQPATGPGGAYGARSARGVDAATSTTDRRETPGVLVQHRGRELKRRARAGTGVAGGRNCRPRSAQPGPVAQPDQQLPFAGVAQRVDQPHQLVEIVGVDGIANCVRRQTHPLRRAGEATM
jgi:hypothetical protein